jgi:hypothetical protein
MPETSLHAALKTWYAQPGDSAETLVDGYIIDIRRGDTLIEIQTRNFSSMRHKLEKLLAHYPVHLVHPIAVEKWIVHLENGKATQRRKSPKHGRTEHMFNELVYIPHLLNHPNFSLQILFTEEEETWVKDGGGSWRRKGWRIIDRKLIGILGTQEFCRIDEYRNLVPANLPETFTASDLARHAQLPRQLAQKMAYTLRASEIITVNRRVNRAYEYRLNQLEPDVGS